jgi:hypothetical protein
MIVKLIRSLFYVPKRLATDNDNIYSSIQPIKYSFYGKMRLFLISLFPGKRKESIYEKGQRMVKNEINMFTIIETLMKIKASLTVLIGDDQ